MVNKQTNNQKTLWMTWPLQKPFYRGMNFLFEKTNNGMWWEDRLQCYHGSDWRSKSPDLVHMGSDVKEATTAVIRVPKSWISDGDGWGVVWMTVKRGVEEDTAGWQGSPSNRVFVFVFVLLNGWRSNGFEVVLGRWEAADPTTQWSKVWVSRKMSICLRRLQGSSELKVPREERSQKEIHQRWGSINQRWGCRGFLSQDWGVENEQWKKLGTGRNDGYWVNCEEAPSSM